MTLSQVASWTQASTGRTENLEARIAGWSYPRGSGQAGGAAEGEYKAVKEKYRRSRRTVIDRDGQVEVTVVKTSSRRSIDTAFPDGYLQVIPDGKRQGRKDYPVLASFTANTTDYIILKSPTRERSMR